MWRRRRRPSNPPEFEKAYTEHLGQLITAPGKGGVNELNNRANGTVGMRGTDLGVSFESRGRLYFLFGDTFALGGGTHLDDSIAVTDARSVDRFRMPSAHLGRRRRRVLRPAARAPSQPRRHGGPR